MTVRNRDHRQVGHRHTRPGLDLLKDEQGATVIEYALICGLIVMVMIVGFNGFGTATQNTWNTVSTQMSSAVGQAAA